MKVSTFTLQNQSKLLVIPLPFSQSVTTMALVSAGPRYDAPDKDGLSHFVEHMLFKGTKKFPTSQKLASVLEKRGGSAQAYSFHETNQYWIKTIASDFELAVENLLDRMQNPLFRSLDIKTEKGVVFEELEILKSNPERLIWDLWSKTVWDGTNLGRVYLGDKATIKTFNKNDVADFFKKYYGGNSIIYAVCGNINPNKACDIFNKFIRPSINTSSQIKNNHVLSTSKTNQSYQLVKTEVENVTAAVGFKTVCYQNKDRFILELIASILGGGMSSRLRKNVMEPGLTYSIEAYSEHLSDTGYFMIRFSTGKNLLNQTLAVIIKELEELKHSLINKNELELAKGYFKGDLQINIETSYDFANWYARNFLLGNTILNIEEICNLINKITNTDIKNIANKYFQLSDFKMALIGDVSGNDIKLALG